MDEDRKSTRLNSSHGYISYAVFCLKKKNKSPDGRLGRRTEIPVPTERSDARLEFPSQFPSLSWTVAVSFFFFNDTATTEIYTLSLHDALPISRPAPPQQPRRPDMGGPAG